MKPNIKLYVITITVIITVLFTCNLSAQVFVKNSVDDTTFTILDNGNIGIGTLSPIVKLDVYGTVHATSFTGNGSALTGTGDNLGNHTATQNLRLNSRWLSNDGGNEGIFIDVAGKVGVGTSSPNATFEAYKDLYIGSDGNVESYETVGTLGWYNNDENSLNQMVGGISMINRNGWWDGNVDKMDAALTFRTMENSIVSEVMRIDFNGNVGIGVTVPNFNLEVNGTFQADNVRSGSFDLPVTNGSSGQYLSYDGTWTTPVGGNYTAGDDLDLTGTEFSLENDISLSQLRASTGDGLRIFDDGSNIALQIIDGGNIGVGTTSPGFKLEVDGTFQADNVRSGTFNLPTTNGTIGEYLRWDGTWGLPAATDGDWGLNGNDVYTGTGGIYPTGNVGIGTFAPSGDARLEIANIGSGISGIKVDTPGQNGLWVEAPVVNGIYVNSPGYYGLAVTNPTQGGVYVNSSSGHGVEIENSTKNGMFIDNSSMNGIRIYESAYWGIHIDTTGFSGMKISKTGTHGIDIYETGQHGIQITQADEDGVHVTSAADDALFGDSDQSSGEWGVYTPDKIYGSNLTSKNMSIYGYNSGNVTLKPGDVVSISSGYVSNVAANDNSPVIMVSKANQQNSEALIGVVEYKVSIKEKLDMSERFVYDGESVNPGDYLSIIVFGLADVKMNSQDKIKVGQKLTISKFEGRARQINDTDSWTIGILGKALENSNGSGVVKVFVNCK